tara:strand:+ start:2241 stop:2669 length:429 start_codon:yes stop_codon:yes gene_type:complete
MAFRTIIIIYLTMTTKKTHPLTIINKNNKFTLSPLRGILNPVFYYITFLMKTPKTIFNLENIPTIIRVSAKPYSNHVLCDALNYSIVWTRFSPHVLIDYSRQDMIKLETAVNTLYYFNNCEYSNKYKNFITKRYFSDFRTDI